MPMFFAAALVVFLSGCAAAPDSGSREDSEPSERPDRSAETTGKSGPPDYVGSSRPPESTLSYGGETVSGELGTYCWESGSNSICADAIGIPVKEEVLTVSAGSTLKFEYGGSKLDSLTVTADRIGQGNHLEKHGNISILVLEGGGRRTIRLQTRRSGTRAYIAAELPAGKYVVAASIRVPQGDAMYGFRVVVK